VRAGARSVSCEPTNGTLQCLKRELSGTQRLPPTQMLVVRWWLSVFGCTSYFVSRQLAFGWESPSKKRAFLALGNIMSQGSVPSSLLTEVATSKTDSLYAGQSGNAVQIE
jgi:hypothetical protein